MSAVSLGLLNVLALDLPDAYICVASILPTCCIQVHQDGESEHVYLVVGHAPIACTGCATLWI